MGRARSQLGLWISVDRVSGLVLAILSLVVIFDLRKATHLAYWDQSGPGPSWLPATLAVMLLILSLPLIFSRGRTEAAQLGASRSGTIKYILLVLALAWAFPVVGGLLSMGLFMVIEMVWVERQRWPTSVAAALVCMAIVWVVFVSLLGIPLPTGPLGI
jgi:hypothetical protein